MRHLTGPRINLGARDIAALGRYTRSRSETHRTDSRSIVKNIVAGNPEVLNNFIGKQIALWGKFVIENNIKETAQ